MFLPASVARPIRVSRLSEAGQTSSSGKLLESDILKNYCFPCQLLVPNCVFRTVPTRLGFYFWLGTAADFSVAAAARRLALFDRSFFSRSSNSFSWDFSLTFRHRLTT